MKVVGKIALLGVLFASMGYSQVGINTDEPKATLHINAENPKNPDSSAGIIIPRVEVNPTNGNEKGQMIFNITDNAFYYWSGQDWLTIGKESELKSSFVDTRKANPMTITNDSNETLVPGAMIEFVVAKTKPVHFSATVNFAGTSSAFVPLFKLKLTNIDTSTEEIIDQASNTFLSDGISTYIGKLPLMTVKNLSAGRYRAEVLAYYNDCCSFDFNYRVGGADTPVSILIQH